MVADLSANINTDRKMHDCNDVIMPGEVEIVCTQLKLNKSCGYDGIRAENLRHADKTTYVRKNNNTQIKTNTHGLVDMVGLRHFNY